MFSLLTALALSSVAIADQFGSWQNLQVNRIVSPKESTLEIVTNVQAKNTGSSPSSSIFVGIDKSFVDKVGYITATIGERNLPLKAQAGPDHSKLWEVKFDQPIGPGSSVSFDVIMTLGNVYKPAVAKTLQMEKNEIIIEAPMFLFSPYPTKDSTTSVRFIPTLQTVSNISPAESRATGSEVTWPSKPVTAFQSEHLSFKTPFTGAIPSIKSAKRVIEVSQWGNVGVVEEYKLLNGAAALDGEFSRIPFAFVKNGNTNPLFKVDGHLSSLTGILPRYARNLQYFDVIGNVSTSHAHRVGKQYVMVSLEPRFPLLGGWKTDFQFQYDMPLKYLVKDDSESVELQLPLNHPFSGVFTDSMEIELLLPEGSTDVVVDAPREISQIEYGTKRSWLDTPIFGGHVVAKFRIAGGFTLAQKEVLNHKFTVSYKLGTFWKYRPAILLSFYFLVLLFSIAAFSSNSSVVAEPDSPSLNSEQSYTLVDENQKETKNASPDTKKKKQ